MNAERLLTRYDRIADASNAIARLRRFVLDLAVRGKLVEQDPADEPASELLKRIAAEKARLVKAGEIRKTKAVPSLEPDGLPFPLPHGWAWTQIAEIGVISPRNEAPDDLEASFVPMPMIAAEYGEANGHEPRQWGEIKKGYIHFAEGDVGLAKITPCFENGKSTVFRNLIGGIGAGTTELHVVRPLFVDADYIVLFLKSPYFIQTGIPKMTGTAGQKRVPKEYFTTSPFPLPPLAEQRRIVAKVDELMALLDRLEAARTAREATRDRLTAASLARLTAPDTEPETFPNDARFAIATLPALTARADQIKPLRQAIINLAVRGKLVEQDPADEPASVLLDRAKKAKKALREERRIGRSEGPEYSESPGEASAPRHWSWSYLADFAMVLGGKRLPAGTSFSKEPTEHIYIRVTDMKGGTISDDGIKFISPEVQNKIAKYTIDQEDIYITIAGTIAEVGMVPALFHGQNLTENAAKIVFREVDRGFLILALRSNDVQSQFAEKTKQMAQPKLALKRILGARVPLPPLAEQHRIVAKVDALMTLCDRLETALAQADATRARLLEALLHEALAPAADLVAEAAA
ncbi:restriction endonuclease S subunit [Thioflavicoccus mobilis 8321]|uniref:Restriction endonuclease S subunit n=1 Tax=Thioflavicoccus mobilis 8321 TaxID=765912 RepID=L0GZF3_9GAMM|nr:restriction endonuclease subunit S [Thioflavicoccus mobilis]AGA90755.1 restriction endonuclease S subunit [Thioflavicoccus mobilis 8321]